MGDLGETPPIDPSERAVVNGRAPLRVAQPDTDAQMEEDAGKDQMDVESIGMVNMLVDEKERSEETFKLNVEKGQAAYNLGNLG